MKKIALLGSTGSIGRQTLEVLDNLGAEYKVVALTAGKNAEELAAQARKFQPEMVALHDYEAAQRLTGALADLNIQVESGDEGQINASIWHDADLVVMAQVGFSGFQPLVAALRAGKTIALANKESLVVGGELLERLGLLDRSRILPVDSEHSAVWQSMANAHKKEIARIYLTASGGPFFGYPREKLHEVTPEEALKHPN